MVEAPACPRCREALERSSDPPAGRTCRSRHGVLVDAAGRRRLFTLPIESALDEALARGTPGKLACPSCRGGMRVFAYAPPSGGAFVEIDGCPACRSLWFDAGEIERVRPGEHPLAPRPRAVPTAAKGLAADVSAQGVAELAIAGAVEIVAALFSAL